ncbi:unnamed protein product [Heligmosomoides polygyrus]|uniref:Uncharacterized protein n=1 Tax=Heligmosomoides polygyrus TaxID=6339 RepID=A0A183G6C8_HELPZ|nr:unnamed protein product [Heligmosomoides polygyrus]
MFCGGSSGGQLIFFVNVDCRYPWRGRREQSIFSRRESAAGADESEDEEAMQADEATGRRSRGFGGSCVRACVLERLRAASLRALDLC